MSDTVNIKINGKAIAAEKGATILEAARSAGIQIPTLCYLKEINAIGACRICVVEVKGARTLVASCVFPVGEGMEVFTSSPAVLNARKLTLELILSTHKRECLSCVRSGNCELQKLCKDFRVDDESRFDGVNPEYPVDDTSVHMRRDDNKCILCRRCVAACSHWQSVSVIGANDRGFKTHIGCAFDEDLGNVACVSCGQCIVVCPTGAIYEKDETDKVWAAFSDPTKHVIIQTAPSTRVTLGECFDMPVGSNVEGKMVAALRRIGFHGVYDTDFSADLTIMEEAHEFVERLQQKGALPMITSCSPGWVKFCEHKYPEFIPNLSTCKSPQQMFGAIAKSWYAQKKGIKPEDVFVVSAMPCTAKKFEVGRDAEEKYGASDVDVALTTRELGRLINRAGIMFTELPDEEFDAPLDESSGAGVIFGTTGGVMEAALRTAVEELTGEPLGNVEFTEVRGTLGIKEATYNIAGMDVNICVASGLANAARVLDSVKSGEKNYHFIEIMGCPGGCINGGGQPVQPASVRNFVDLKSTRAAALYEADRNKALRKAHESGLIKKLYGEFLGEPGSPRAHELLHTHYRRRARF